jgi:hypothetical protein
LPPSPTLHTHHILAPCSPASSNAVSTCLTDGSTVLVMFETWPLILTGFQYYPSPAPTCGQTDRRLQRSATCGQTCSGLGISKCKAQRMSGVFRRAAHGTGTLLPGSTVRSLANGQHLNLNLPTLIATVRHAARRLNCQNSTRWHVTRINVTSFTPNRKAGPALRPCL